MSWGDPFDKIYKDEDSLRESSLVKLGFMPGSMIRFGQHASMMITIPDRPAYAWTFPDFKADGYHLESGLGIILGVDCESDPSTNWLMLFVNVPSKQAVCWMPTGLVRVV